MGIKYKSNLDNILTHFKHTKEKSMEKIGQFLAEEVSKAAPVDTGELRDSIDYQVDQDGLKIGSKLYYAPMVELGTSKQKAQPFIKNTVDKNVDKIEQIIDDNLSKGR